MAAMEQVVTELHGFTKEFVPRLSRSLERKKEKGTAARLIPGPC